MLGAQNLVIASHTAHTSPTSVSHVGDSSPTSASHVGDSSSTSTSYVGDCLLASASHVGSMSSTTAIHAGGIHMIEKPRRFRRRAKFLCRTCEGNHLTHLCPAPVGIPKSWFSLESPSGSETYVVSPHSVPCMVDTTVMSMQSLANTPFPLWFDASFDLVVSHPIQPVVVSMQSSTDISPMFGGDVSLDLVVSHLIQPTVVSMQSSTNNTLVFLV
jgi:hypothetical protein